MCFGCKRPTWWSLGYHRGRVRNDIWRKDEWRPSRRPVPVMIKLWASPAPLSAEMCEIRRNDMSARSRGQNVFRLV